jgi:plasmid stabilization system protein ParE
VVDVEFHPEARAEYLHALSWYHARSPRAAARFGTEFDRLIDLIARQPESFPHYDDEHRFTVLRRFPYSIVYRVESQRVYVIAIPHSHQPPGYWEGRV